METALNFQILFKFPFWVQAGVANAHMYVKNAVNCNSVTVELPSSKTIALINLISLHKKYYIRGSILN